VKLDLYGWGYSNSFSEWNGRVPKADGTSGDPIQIVTQLIAHTHAFGPLDFTVIPQFILQPGEGQRFQLLNPTLGFQGTLVEVGGFSYWARFETAVPLLEKSRQEGMVVGPQIINSLGYKIPGTRLQAELVLIPSLSVKTAGTTSSLFVSPRLYYNINDSFWLVGISQFGFESKVGVLNLGSSGPVSIGAGMRYTANQGRGLWVQPFANFYAAEKAATTAHLGVQFGGPLL
jgi:hypothetical protein